MEFLASPDILDRIPVPPEYTLYRQYLADNLWQAFMLNLGDIQWPFQPDDQNKQDENTPLEPAEELPRSQRIHYFEQYVLNGLDDRLRLDGAALLAPSIKLTNPQDEASAAVFSIYGPAIQFAERAVDAAFRDAAIAMARLTVLECIFGHPRPNPPIIKYVPALVENPGRDGTVNKDGVFLFAPAYIEGVRAIVQADTGPNRVERDLQITDNALVVCGLHHTRKLITELMAPPPRDLEHYGRPGDKPAQNPLYIDPAAKEVLLPAVLADLNAVFGAALIKFVLGGPDAKFINPIQLVVALRDRRDATIAAISRAITIDLPYVLKIAIALTNDERLTLAKFQEQLDAVWRDVHDLYRFLVENSQTLDELEDALRLEIAGRMERSVQIFEAYRHIAPVLAGRPDAKAFAELRRGKGSSGGSVPSKLDEALQKFPFERDIFLLVDTQIGLKMVEIAQVMRPILSAKESSVIKFFSELPKNMPTMISMLGYTTATGLSAIPISRRIGDGISRLELMPKPMSPSEPLAAIQIYFDTTRAADGSVRIDYDLRAKFQKLRRRKFLEAEDKEAERLQKEEDRAAEKEARDTDRADKERQRAADKAARDQERAEDKEERLKKEEARLAAKERQERERARQELIKLAEKGSQARDRLEQRAEQARKEEARAAEAQRREQERARQSALKFAEKSARAQEAFEEKVRRGMSKDAQFLTTQKYKDLKARQMEEKAALDTQIMREKFYLQQRKLEQAERERLARAEQTRQKLEQSALDAAQKLQEKDADKEERAEEKRLKKIRKLEKQARDDAERAEAERVKRASKLEKEQNRAALKVLEDELLEEIDADKRVNLARRKAKLEQSERDRIKRDEEQADRDRLKAVERLQQAERKAASAAAKAEKRREEDRYKQERVERNARSQAILRAKQQEGAEAHSIALQEQANLRVQLDTETDRVKRLQLLEKQKKATEVLRKLEARELKRQEQERKDKEQEERDKAEEERGREDRLRLEEDERRKKKILLEESAKLERDLALEKDLKERQQLQDKLDDVRRKQALAALKKRGRELEDARRLEAEERLQKERADERAETDRLKAADKLEKARLADEKTALLQRAKLDLDPAARAELEEQLRRVDKKEADRIAKKRDRDAKRAADQKAREDKRAADNLKKKEDDARIKEAKDAKKAADKLAKAAEDAEKQRKRDEEARLKKAEDDAKVAAAAIKHAEEARKAKARIDKKAADDLKKKEDDERRQKIKDDTAAAKLAKADIERKLAEDEKRLLAMPPETRRMIYNRRKGAFKARRGGAVKSESDSDTERDESLDIRRQDSDSDSDATIEDPSLRFRPPLTTFVPAAAAASTSDDLPPLTSGAVARTTSGGGKPKRRNIQE